MIYIILFILFFIFLLLTISYFDNKEVIESFDNISGLLPGSNGSTWTSGFDNKPYLINLTNTCQIGASCNTEDGWGYYNSSCACVHDTYDPSSQLKNNLQEESSYPPEEEYISINNQYKEEEGIISNDCIPNSTNFNDYCNNIHQTYGVKKIIPCDSNNSKVDCASNYMGGIYYGNNNEELIKTPCIDKTSDFNSLCKYYNVGKVPPGYNVNSIGVKYILPGVKGDCYMPNGVEDTGKARGICSYNYNEQISKIPPTRVTSLGNGTTLLMDYNVFTNCHPSSTNFTNKCNKLLKKHKSYASDISSYDCNPGYLRARCIKSNDRFKINKNTFVQNVLHQKHDYRAGEHGSSVISQCPDVCPNSSTAEDIISDITSDITSGITSNPVNSNIREFVNTIGSRAVNVLNSGDNVLNNSMGNVLIPGRQSALNTTPLGSALGAMFSN